MSKRAITGTAVACSFLLLALISMAVFALLPKLTTVHTKF